MSDLLNRAQDFIWRNARLLDRYLFSYMFLDGSLEPVLGALRAYQNDDGGFGLMKGQPSDPELTSYAILALVAGKDTSTAGYRAVRYLRKVQQKDGSYVSATPIELKEPTANIQTTCFAMWAMVAETISKRK